MVLMLDVAAAPTLAAAARKDGLIIDLVLDILAPVAAVAPRSLA
jgi:hypothetical protein